MPIFMLAKDGKSLTGEAFKFLKYEEKDVIKDPYTKRHVAKTFMNETRLLLLATVF